MTLNEINEMPTSIDMEHGCVNKIHESVFKSYHVLNQVLTMVERGDSKETIFELVEFFNYTIN